MRGKRRPAGRGAKACRITPAHAGKTSRSFARRHAGADHPRACGENIAEPVLINSVFGSPPRMRGKRSGAASAGRAARITPAHAGKTAVSRRGGLRAADHPRACGENRISLRSTSSCDGSPPRVRGKHRGARQKRGRTRITPAYAGKTREHTHSLSGYQDHPRVCGENPPARKAPVSGGGSPPRVRGKLTL